MTEEDWNRELDADPKNSFLLLLYADWLEERGDPRAEGYRVMGLMGKRCVQSQKFGFLWVHWFWLQRLMGITEESNVLPLGWIYRLDNAGMWASFSSRKEAEDAAALAWLKLSSEAKSGILKEANVGGGGV